MALYELSMQPTPLPSPNTAPWRGPLSKEKKLRDQLTLPKEITSSPESQWIYITIRRSGRKLLHMPSIPAGQAHTLVLESRRERNGAASTALRDFLWDEFAFMMSDVEDKRYTLKTPNYNKGELKMSAPIPWLLWLTSSGKQGQTRNRDNFCRIWEENVEPCLREGGPRRMQVTSILLPSDPSLEAICEEPLVASFDCGEEGPEEVEEKGAEALFLRPRCDSGISFGEGSPKAASRWMAAAGSLSIAPGQRQHLVL